MRFDGRSKIYCGLFFGWCCLGAGCFAGEVPVAGLQPDRRPEKAPTVKVFEATPQWRKQALRGIGAPATGMGFLEDQGAWYTPFLQPGMPGPYDLRGLHPGGARTEP